MSRCHIEADTSHFPGLFNRAANDAMRGAGGDDAANPLLRFHGALG